MARLMTKQELELSSAQLECLELAKKLADVAKFWWVNVVAVCESEGRDVNDTEMAEFEVLLRRSKKRLSKARKFGKRLMPWRRTHKLPLDIPKRGAIL